MGDINGITDDSRKVKPGMIFVAVKGKNKLTANSANELYELIKKFNQSIKEQ